MHSKANFLPPTKQALMYFICRLCTPNWMFIHHYLTTISTAKITVIPQSYMIGGSQTDVSWEYTTEGRFFPINTILKWGRWLQTICFEEEEKVNLYLWNAYKKYEIWQTNDNLRRRHFLLNFRLVILIINSTVQWRRRRYTSPWTWLEEIKHRSQARQRSLLLHQNLITASKYPNNSLSSCCHLLPISISVFWHPDASFSQ